MIDDKNSVENTVSREHVQKELAKFHLELATREDALASAFHFDERDAVRPSYENLIRLPSIHDELLEQLKSAHPLFESQGPASAAAHNETIRLVDEIMAVLRDMSVGIDHYTRLHSKLTRLKYELRDAIARLGE